jgi:hypothetical protein
VTAVRRLTAARRCLPRRRVAEEVVMILILTQEQDRTADVVCRGLEARRAAYLRFDPAHYPTAAGISVSFSARGRPQAFLQYKGVVHDLRRVRTMWCRRPGAPAAVEGFEERIRDYIAQECRDFLRSLYDLIDCAWVPGPFHLLDRTQHKL